jgi:hypothetical protein
MARFKIKSTKVRRKLFEDEKIDTPSSGEKYEKLFLGSYYGIGLSRSLTHKEDPHVFFTLLCKIDHDIGESDEFGTWKVADETWRIGKRRTGPVRSHTSYFLFELQAVIHAACVWLNENAESEEASSTGCSFTPSGVIGWNFAQK